MLANIEAISTYVLKSRILNGVHTAKAETASHLRGRILELIQKKNAAAQRTQKKYSGDECK